MKTNWKTINNRLVKEFTFKNFNESLAFINKVGEESENINHHPKIVNVYNKVRIELWTHSNNSISELDHKLSKSIDRVLE